MVKRIFRIALLVLLIFGFMFYAVTLWYSEGINRYDVTGRVNLVAEDCRIELPWYLAGAELYYSRNGADINGDDYTKFYYDLPAFLETEMECVVNWTDETVVAYIGEPRGMDIVDADYLDVEWN